MDHDGPDPLTRLRAAAAAVADLDGADTSEEQASRDQETHDEPGFDATAHADRFTELHDALETVLADVDRG